MSRATEVLDKVKATVEQRERNYDNPNDNFYRISKFDEALAELPEGPVKVALRNIGQKMARLIHVLLTDPTELTLEELQAFLVSAEDQWIDIIGYALCGLRCWEVHDIYQEVQGLIEDRRFERVTGTLNAAGMGTVTPDRLQNLVNTMSQMPGQWTATLTSVPVNGDSVTLNGKPYKITEKPLAEMAENLEKLSASLAAVRERSDAMDDEYMNRNFLTGEQGARLLEKANSYDSWFTHKTVPESWEYQDLCTCDFCRAWRDLKAEDAAKERKQYPENSIVRERQKAPCTCEACQAYRESKKDAYRTKGAAEQ